MRRRRLMRRRLLWRRLLLRRGLRLRLLLLLLVRRRRRDWGLRAARAGTHRTTVLVKAHAWRRGAEVVKATAAAASSAPVEAAAAAAATPEPVPRHWCGQGAVEAEAQKTLGERGGHLASHKMADDTGGAPPLSSSYIAQVLTDPPTS